MCVGDGVAAAVADEISVAVASGDGGVAPILPRRDCCESLGVCVCLFVCLSGGKLGITYAYAFPGL